jgi:hypothetical protein
MIKYIYIQKLCLDRSVLHPKYVMEVTELAIYIIDNLFYISLLYPQILYHKKVMPPRHIPIQKLSQS